MEILGLEKRKSIAHGPFLRKLLKDVLQHIKGGGKTRRRCGARETGIPGRREEGGGGTYQDHRCTADLKRNDPEGKGCRASGEIPR